MTIEEFQMVTSAGEPQTNKTDADRRRNPSTLVNEFASYTTLHGFHFVLESFSLVRRILWAILLLLGLGLLMMQCQSGYQKLTEHDSLTVKEQQRGKAVLFPAVTICNQNMLRKDKIIGTEAQTFLDNIESLLFNETIRNDENETFTLDLDQVTRKAGHNITELLQACTWQGKLCGPEDFHVFISEHCGLCYTFNSGKPGHHLHYQSVAGRDHGLLLQLDAQPEQYYGPFNLLEGTGFRVLVHDQNEWPDMENYGIDISPGFTSTIRIQRFKTIRLPPPYKSRCGDRKLESTGTYSYSACFKECWTRALVDKCHCKTLGMAQLAECKSLRYCGPEKFVKCIIPANGEFLVNFDCDCPTECESLRFDYQLSSSSFPSRHLLPIIMKRSNISVPANKSEEFYSKVETGLRRHLLQLNVFYQTVVTEITKEKPAYDIHEFGSDVGGNMGLFLGCSLLTLFEFVDLLILICLRNCRADQKVQISR